MLRFIFSLENKKTHIKKVSLVFSIKPHFCSTASHIVTSAPLLKTTHFDDLSSIDFTGLAQSFLSKYLHLSNNENENRRLQSYGDNHSLKELLLDISDVIPGLVRCFNRTLRLRSEDVLELLLGFQFQCDRVAVKSSKVQSLWGIFKWVSDQNKGFKHLPKSCEVMGSVLIKYGMFREVQLLLLAMERQGISLDNSEIFSKLIEGYVAASDIERAVLMYDRMRDQNFVPSLFCYRVLIDLLVRMRRTRRAFLACVDMMETGSTLTEKEIVSIEKVVRLLCEDEMVQEARNVMEKVMALGFEPGSTLINQIASGYGEKKEFEHFLSFFVEMKCSPNRLVGHKILCCLCSHFGMEKADFFRLELEGLGFSSDEITFGIFLGWCCSKGNLTNAFFYLSEMLSRGLRPSIWSYNALIAALFREGMWKHARSLLDEMADMGITPNLSTFRTYLAGYCKARRFDEVQMMVEEMVNRGFIESSSLENPLSKAFMILGFDPLSVRLKRDNDAGFFMTECFDNLGNGLYLDTDLDEYEKRVTRVLNDSVFPNFNSLVLEECDLGHFKAALLLIDEVVQWGQEVSLSVLSALVKGLCSSRSHIRACSYLIEKMPKLAIQLDGGVLNLLVRAYCKSGLTYKGRMIFNQMLSRDIRIENGTYSALLVGSCKKGNLRDVLEFWDIARNSKWSPALEDCKFLFECLCHHKMLKEALELLESMLVSLPGSGADVLLMFLEKLSITGFTSIMHQLMVELLNQGCVLNDIAYNHLLRGLCKERNYALAFMILDQMLGRDLSPCLDVSLLLIPELCQADRVEKAIALRDICLRRQSTYQFSVDRALIRGFCKTGKVETASNLVQDMLFKGLLPDSEIYNMLLQGYCQTNDMMKVREVLSVLIRKFLSPSISSYQKLASLMCMHGNLNSALNLKALMVGHNGNHSLVVYNILVFHLLSAGNRCCVDGVLKEMQDNGLQLDEVTYNFLLHGFSKCKDVYRVAHYLSTMMSKGFRPNNRSLRTAITCLCELRHFGEVLQLSQEMEKRGWVHGSVVQDAIVELFISLGKLQEAEYFLHRMADKGLIPDTINYDNLVKRFCLYGRLNKAVDLLNIMLSKGNIPNSACYDSIIQGLCTRNQLNEAMDFHFEMLNRDLKPSLKTWDMLAQRLCQLGQTEQAESLLVCMAELGETPTRHMYSSVINRYRLESNPRKTSELMQMMQRSGYEPDFEAHWSLINILQNSQYKDGDNNSSSRSSKGFLSRLLSGSGF